MGGEFYPFAEKQSVYSTTAADWATRWGRSIEAVGVFYSPSRLSKTTFCLCVYTIYQYDQIYSLAEFTVDPHAHLDIPTFVILIHGNISINLRVSSSDNSGKILYYTRIKRER